ncbi:MAG: hypothetical protein AAGA19_03345 [Pseudomonadota bacterium]
MRTGWAISLGLHAGAIVVGLFFVPYDDDRDRDLQRVTSVTLEAPPAPQQQPQQAPEIAPEIQDFSLDSMVIPTFDPNAPPPPVDDLAPIETVQDFVEDPSERDAEADLTDLLVQAEQPDVAVDVNALSDAIAEAPDPVLSLPGTAGLDTRSEAPQSPTLGAPSAPSAPRIASVAAPPPPRPQPPTPDVTPDTSPAEEAEIAEQNTPDSAPEEAENRPTAETEAGAETGIALLEATPPRVRPRDFEQQVAEAARRAEEERLAEAARRADEAREAAAAAEQEAIRLAVAEAQEEAAAVARAVEAAAAIQGPPLTAGEVDGFKLAVSRCWRIPDGVENAADLTVIVSVDFGVDGRVVGGPTLIEPANDSRPEIRTAFESARRAILRCAGGGYDLPRDKYEQWKTLELVFEPSGFLARF